MTYNVIIDGQHHAVTIGEDGRPRVGGNDVAIDVQHVGENTYSVLFGEQSVTIVARRDGDSYQLLLRSLQYDVVVESERDILLKKFARETVRASHRRELRAPMPALVIKVEVSVGEKVTAGQGLLVLEAMKMENELRAPQDGKVEQIYVLQGKPVEKGELLMLLG